MKTYGRSTSFRSTALCVAGAVAFATLAAPASAFASTTDQSDASSTVIAESLANVGNTNPALLHDSVATGTGTTQLGSGEVSVPSALSDGVTMTGEDGDLFTIQLPNASAAGAPVTLPDGTVTYPGESSANSIVVSDLGVQMLTTIVGADAPTDYSYEVTLDEGQTLALVDDGAAILNPDGSTAVIVGDAWAVDADGANVSTSYAVEGSTLTQSVDHTAAENVAYPVVADPVWFAPAVIRCLLGIGLNAPQISNIIASGSPGSLGGAFAKAALACIKGK